MLNPAYQPNDLDSSGDSSVNREIRSDVFMDLFGQNEYTFQLFQALHPEDTTATIEDLKIVTLSHVLTDRQYNDLGFRVGNRLIILIEHQSTWSENIVVRIFLYIAQTLNDYINENKLNLYSAKKIKLPKVEAYVVYTGDKEDCPETLNLNDLYWDGDDNYAINVRVKVIRDGRRGDIINQYVGFVKVLNEQVKIHGKTTKAIEETIRICKERNILREYLQKREPEVKRIMITLFSQEQIQEYYGEEKRREGWEEARAEFGKREAEFGKREAELKEEAQKAVERTRREKALEVAKKMLADSILPVDMIAKYSEAPLSDVEALAKSMGK